MRRARQGRASREERLRRAAAPFALDLHLDPRELAEDLCWPSRPPGRWLERDGAVPDDSRAEPVEAVATG